MPLRRCQAEGTPGWRWGKRGKCFTGGNARARALKQARAIRASGFTGNVCCPTANVHRRIRTQIVPSNPLKADPTRSATLRRIFTTDLTRRFFALKSKILRLIVDEDAFGLRRPGPFTLFNKEQSDGVSTEEKADASFTGPYNRDIRECRGRSGRPDGKLTESREKAGQVSDSNGNAGRLVRNQRWAALTDPAKVQEFQQWLATQIQTDILTTTAENLEDVYWQRYVEEGYRKGAGRAFDDTRKAALSSGADVSDFYQGTREEFLRSAFAQPVAIEKVQLLTSRVFTDLKGVTEAMSAQITRTLADGLVQGQNPRKIASELNKVVDGIGKRRATLIARTEIIRAHAEGQLDAFERLGVTKLGVMVEWSTAGDDRVCPLCEPLEGTILSLKEARGILPRHPQCRCAYIPANVGESTKGQNRSPVEVRKAIDDSIRAEIPKRQVGKRTLAQQKRRTPWAGADKTIAKKRPRSILEPPPSKVSPKPKPKAIAKPRKVTPVPRLIGRPEFAKDIDPTIGKFVAESFENEVGRLASKLPGVRSILKRRRVNLRVAGDVTEAGTAGRYSTELRAVVINPNSLELSDDLVLGRFSVGGNSLAPSIRHELGHHLSTNLTDELEELWAQVALRGGKKRIKQLAKGLSDYAETNGRELFSEAFTAYAHPKYKRGILHRDLEEFFDTLLQKVK